jgi:GntP family gluconate:H+ symporter
MLFAALVAVAVLVTTRGASRTIVAKLVDDSLASAGVIILITAAGGAFGAMLKEAQIGSTIEGHFVSGSGGLGGHWLLLLGFFVAFLIKFAQGSSTVSMMTTAGMMASLIADPTAIGFHPVYLATAIGFGAQCGNWMNDSGFWVFAKMGGLTEVEALKTWTVTVSLIGVVGFLVVALFAAVLPYPFPL